MKNKTSIILLLITFIFVLIMSSLFVYSYYLNNNTDKETIIKEFNVLLNYENNEKIVGNNLYNGWQYTYNFDIENFSSDTVGNYKLVFEIITPLSNMINEDFVYNIESTSESDDKTNVTISKTETPVPVVSRDLGVGVITPNNKHIYTLNIYIKDTNKAILNDKLFVAKVKIVNN